VSYGSDGAGGLREDTATDRAIDRGDVRRGRAAHEQLSRLPLRWRVVLLRLVDVAHTAADVGAHARHYAGQWAPLEVREAAQSAPWAAQAAATAYARAKRVASAALTPETLAILTTAHDRAEATAARERAALAALTAWGEVELAGAVGAWDAAGAEAEAA